jgi:hypothetical protein
MEMAMTRDEAIRFVDKIHNTLRDVVAEGNVMDEWLAHNSTSDTRGDG